MIARMVLFVCISIICFAVSVCAEIHPDSTATIANLLEDAGYPLTDVQADSLTSLRMGLGFSDMYHTLNLTLSDDQKDVLIDAFGPGQGTPEWRTAPRWLHWLVIFDNYHQSLTKSQVDRLKAQPTGRLGDPGFPTEPIEKIEDILTEEQLALILEMYKNRGDN